ncbi:MAG: hypothetical protein ACRYE9_02000 [Janthinobacterium lividum]
MKKNILKFLARIAMLASTDCLLVAIIRGISVIKLSSTNPIHYSTADSNGYDTAQITENAILKANTNYNGISNTAIDSSFSCSLDPNHYNKQMSYPLLKRGVR